MRRASIVFGAILVASFASVASALADEAPAAPPASAASSAAAPAPSGMAAPAPSAAPAGFGVVAAPGSADAAWPLAQGVYADPSLRPALDDAHARVLCGDAPPEGSPPDLRDLAESVAAVHGDDAPSRLILESLMARFSLRGVLVVRAEGGRPVAHVFLPGTRTFDAASYTPDEGTGTVLAWSGAVHSLARAFGSAAPAAGAPRLATSEPPKPAQETHNKAFYESGWFWGALGAALLAGGTAFLVSRDSSPSTIHLEAQVPH